MANTERSLSLLISMFVNKLHRKWLETAAVRCYPVGDSVVDGVMDGGLAMLAETCCRM
jgi:hypothetical protein